MLKKSYKIIHVKKNYALEILLDMLFWCEAENGKKKYGKWVHESFKNSC